MAEDDTNEEESGKSGGLKKMIILAVLGLVLIGGSVGGTLYFLGTFDEESGSSELADGSDSTAGAEDESAVKQPAIYYPLKPNFIVNFQARGRQRYLQVSVSVMAREQEVIDVLQVHMPLIRNKLVLLFGGQVYEELQTEEGRELMRQNALLTVQAVMKQELGRTGVEQILFTNLVMQ